MAKPVSVNADVFIGGSILILWVLNYLSAKWLEFPFLYCWLRAPAVTLYMAFGTLIIYASVGYVLFQFIRNDMIKAIGGALVVVAVIELPHLADYLFRLGASCE